MECTVVAEIILKAQELYGMYMLFSKTKPNPGHAETPQIIPQFLHRIPVMCACFTAEGSLFGATTVQWNNHGHVKR